MSNTLTRTAFYRAFPPAPEAVAAFDAIQTLRRDLWSQFCAHHRRHVAARNALQAADATIGRARAVLAASPGDKPAMAALAAALTAWKAGPDAARLAEEFNAERRGMYAAIVARGLAADDWNALMNTFRGAVASAAARGALPGDGDQRAATGDQVVNQVLAVPARRLADNAKTAIFPARQPGWHAKQKPGSRKAKRPLMHLDITVRGPRHAMGGLKIGVDFIQHRPLPPNAEVMQVRLLRSTRHILNRGRQPVVRDTWSVAITYTMDRPVHEAAGRAAGVALTWRGGGDDETPFILVQDKRRSVEHHLMAGHEEGWDRHAEMKAAALALPDGPERCAAMIEAAALYGALKRRRRDFLRQTAAMLARRYSCVAIEATWLAGKGTKRHTSPAEFRLLLKTAVENNGGEFLVVALPKSIKPGKDRAEQVAKYLFGVAEEAEDGDEFSGDGSAIPVGNQRIAA